MPEPEASPWADPSVVSGQANADPSSRLVWDGVLGEARRALLVEAEAVRALADRLDARFVRAVELLVLCRGRVVLTGMGKSGLVAKKVAATLAATGTPALFLHPADGVHGDLGMLVGGDVVIAVSNSGETDELVALLPAIKRLGLALVLLTGRPESRLAQYSAVVLDVSVREEACPMNLTPTASTTAALALGDALAIAVLGRRGIRPEDLARLHPGGALGRQLLRVEELMHRGPAIPIVPEDASLDDVIREMSAKGLGVTAVVDMAGRLTGIVTDGDLRRAFQRHRGTRAPLARELMTRAPKTVARTELAASALELMERFAITQLLTVDNAGRPDGILHLHDLLRAKIA
jgi:arabinose-5-phosphate isomerase